MKNGFQKGMKGMCLILRRHAARNRHLAELRPTVCSFVIAI